MFGAEASEKPFVPSFLKGIAIQLSFLFGVEPGVNQLRVAAVEHPLTVDEHHAQDPAGGAPAQKTMEILGQQWC
ncbi:MAG: hypothetical protein P8X86_12425 [Desulfofustis sp.]